MPEEAHCRRCGRKISEPKSVERGYGSSCYQKYCEEVAKADFERRQTKLNFNDVFHAYGYVD